MSVHGGSRGMEGGREEGGREGEGGKRCGYVCACLLPLERSAANHSHRLCARYSLWPSIASCNLLCAHAVRIQLTRWHGFSASCPCSLTPPFVSISRHLPPFSPHSLPLPLFPSLSPRRHCLQRSGGGAETVDAPRGSCIAGVRQWRQHSGDCAGHG